MKKITIFILTIMSLTGCTVARPRPPFDANRLNWNIEANLALQEADQAFARAVADKIDMTNGPCLSNAVYGQPNHPETLWVLDIVHNPRTEADDQPANQCSAYLEGRVKNYIEFDQGGNVVRVYSPYFK